MPPVGFEPTITAGERPQTYALDRAAIGIGTFLIILPKYNPSYIGPKISALEFTLYGFGS